ncbi:site-specific integrase, partial [Marinimicrobium sp. UBA4509]
MSAVTLPAQESQALEQYLDAIWMEKGLSENTLNSYRR